MAQTDVCGLIDLGESRICLELWGQPDASVSTPLLSPEEIHPANYDSNSIWEGHTDRGIIPAWMGGTDRVHTFIFGNTLSQNSPG